MPAKRPVRKKTNKGTTFEFGSLGEALEYVDKRSAEAAETTALLKQMTGFPPGQPLDCVGVAKVVHKILQKEGLAE